VKRALPLLVVTLLLATPANAVDWGRAGGALFARPAALAGNPQPDRSDLPAGQDVRVPTPVEPYAAAIDAAARAHGLDPKLLHALVIVESAYRTRARSRVGAEGLSQLMPATASAGGVRDAYNPGQNLDGGARYLAAQIVRFGDLRLALAAYNAGPARVARTGRTPQIAETEAYVSAVVDCYLALSAGRSPRAARACQEGGPKF
jgi:soluble lytic murein transglycosylase-like protein